MSSKRNPALLFIFITLLIDVTGLGIIIPVMPDLIQQLTGGTIAQASKDGGWLLFAYAITQFVFAPLIGGLSDRYGRRPVLLGALLGFSIDYLFLAFAPTLAWLFVGRIIAGIMGASFTTGAAYIADISTSEDRAKNFGLIGMAFGVGFIVGPVIGGLLGSLGLRAPFMAAAALTFLNFLYGFFILPESLKQENRRKFEWSRVNPFGLLKHLQQYPVVLGIAATYFLLNIGGQAPPSIWAYFTIELFEWSEGLIGWSLGFVGLTVGIVQGALIGVIVPKLGKVRAIYLGLTLQVIGLALFGLGTQSWMMFAFVIPYALGGISGPAMQSIMSEEVPANEQGELQGALTSLMSLTAIIGPPLFTNTFAYFAADNTPVYFPGAPFIVASFVVFIGIFVAMRTLRNYKK